MRKTLFLTLAVIVFYSLAHTQLPAVDRPVPGNARVELTKTGSPNKHSYLTRVNFENFVHTLYDSIGLAEYQLDYKIFRKAMIGYYSLEREGALGDKGLITIINFERPSTDKRFFTIDLNARKVKYHTYVAHGRNTGENMAKNFSNTPHSNQSSLGFYVTGETYFGSKGYSLRLDGKEGKFNDKIRSRAVVIHAAEYATEKWITRYGRLGRSQGCPALPPALNKEIINTIKDRTPIFTYYPDNNYLAQSRYLKIDELFKKLDIAPIELSPVRSPASS